MKKLLIIVFLLTLGKINFAQSPVTDTIGYLRDSIQAKREYYIGKPLLVLLNDLKIEVKSYMDIIPFASEPDTIQFKVTSLQFYNNTDLVSRQIDRIISPHIDIIFTAPIPIPKKLFKSGNILYWGTGWTPEKAAFFGNYIISDLQVRGL